MFLQLLQLLRPCMQGQSQLQEWWTLVIEPIINGTGYKKIEIQRASEFLVEILDYDSEGEGRVEGARISSHFTDILVSMWLKRTRVPLPDQDTLTAEDEHVARLQENVLIEFGKRKPRDFMTVVDRILISKGTRLQALSLLSAFVRHEIPHLHTVSQTTLIENLLKCLMIDTSSTAISLALTNLLMFLPHIPTSVKIHLPRLFLIYSRLLCWERFRPQSKEAETSDENEEDDQDQFDDEYQDALEETDGGQSWERLESLVDNADLTPAEILHYFTFLYGLYPLNFMSYIQKPRKYLRNVGFPQADQLDLPQTLIRSRTEQFREVHALHPNFYMTTVQEELTDDRWLRSDPAAVVSECMALCLQPSVYEARPRPPPETELPVVPTTQTRSQHPLTQQALSLATSDSRPHVSWRDTQDTAAVSIPEASDATADSPTLPPMARGAAPSQMNMAYLQREVLLLRSDLNFERNVKQQHLARIGQLQRRNIKDASIDAETANLVSTTRALKAKLLKATEAYTALKREAQTGRNHFKNWETDITTKMRVLVEDERKWRAEEEGLRTKVRKLTKDCETLRRLVVDREAKELLAQQKVSSYQNDLEQLDTLRARITELEGQVRKYEEKDIEYTRANDEKDILQTELLTVKMQLQSSVTSQERTQRTSAARIAELQSRLLQFESADGIPPAIQQRVNAIILASDAKLQALKKEHVNLRHRYVELEVRCQELEQELSLGGPGAQAGSLISATEGLSLTRFDSEPSLHSALSPGSLLDSAPTKAMPSQGLLRSGTVSRRQSPDTRSMADGETNREAMNVAGALYGQNSSRFSMDSFSSAGNDSKSNDGKKTRTFGRGK